MKLRLRERPRVDDARPRRSSHVAPRERPVPRDHPLLRLQRTVGNRMLQRLVGGNIQRLASKDDLWDAYMDAYDARMEVSGRKDEQWQQWLQAFFNFEKLLYAAKDQGGGKAYDAPKLQDKYDTLVHLGLTPPPKKPDAVVAAAASVLHEARERFLAFRGNKDLNRGAWAGSNLHGAEPKDYVKTELKVIDRLLEQQKSGRGRLGTWWLMKSDSSPSGYALHRGAVDNRGDFIYHL